MKKKIQYAEKSAIFVENMKKVGVDCFKKEPLGVKLKIENM